MDGSTWFTLWSSLCHQNDCYTASYAALPHLLAIAEARQGTDALFDPLHLAACIELARLEGTGPVLPSDLAPSYLEALNGGAGLARDALALPWPRDYKEALRASLAAFEGRAVEARAILDSEPDDDVIEEDGRLL